MVNKVRYFFAYYYHDSFDVCGHVNGPVKNMYNACDRKSGTTRLSDLILILHVWKVKLGYETGNFS